MREHVVVRLSVYVISARIFFVLENVIDSTFSEPFSLVCNAPAVKFKKDVLHVYAHCVLIEDIADHFGPFLVNNQFFAVFFVAVGDASARKVSFQTRFIHAASDLLG